MRTTNHLNKEPLKYAYYEPLKYEYYEPLKYAYYEPLPESRNTFPGKS